MFYTKLRASRSSQATTLTLHVFGTSAISLHYISVWQAWQSFCLANHVHLGQCCWQPRRHGWRQPHARHLSMHTTSLAVAQPDSGPCRSRQGSQAKSFSGRSGSPRAAFPGCATGQVGTVPQNRAAGRGAGEDRGTASGSPLSSSSRGDPAGFPGPAVPLLPRGDGAAWGKHCGGCRRASPPPGGYRGAGAGQRSGVPRGGARGATAPRCRPRPRQPRSPAPHFGLSARGDGGAPSLPPSIPSPPGWRAAAGGGEAAGRAPAEGSFLRGSAASGRGAGAAGCAGGSRGPGGAAGAGGGGFLFWGGRARWGENGDCRLRLFLSGSRGSRIAAAAAAAAARRERGEEGCGALGEAGSSGSSLLPSWWPWSAAPRGRSQRAPAAARDAFLQGNKLMRSPRPPPPAPLPPSPLVPCTPASASPARHPRLSLPTVWTIPATCPSWKKLWINCWRATTSACGRISEVSGPARALLPGDPPRTPRPRCRGASRRRVKLCSARRSARLRGDEHRHRQHRHGFRSQHGEWVAGEPGRRRGCRLGHGRPFPVPPFSRSRCCLGGRRWGCAGLRALPSSLENFISLETRFPPSPLIASHCRRPSPRVYRAPGLRPGSFSSPGAAGGRSSLGLRRSVPWPRSRRDAGRAGEGRPASRGRGCRAAAVGISLLLTRFRGKPQKSPVCLWVNSDVCECFKACWAPRAGAVVNGLERSCSLVCPRKVMLCGTVGFTDGQGGV